MCQYFEDEEFSGNLIRHVTNGETSVNIVRHGNDVVCDEDDFYIGDINDEDIKDKIDEFAEEWQEINWNTSDWAEYYGCDEEDVEDCMDDDMRDFD